jgi:hypothetical protein
LGGACSGADDHGGGEERCRPPHANAHLDLQSPAAFPGRRNGPSPGGSERVPRAF